MNAAKSGILALILGAVTLSACTSAPVAAPAPTPFTCPPGYTPTKLNGRSCVLYQNPAPGQIQPMPLASPVYHESFAPPPAPAPAFGCWLLVASSPRSL